MTSYPVSTAAGLGLLLSTLASFGGSPITESISAPSNYEGLTLPDFDVLSLTATQTGEMDFDNGPGNLSVSNFNLTSFLSQPISLTSSLTVIPLFSYSYTSLDFDNATFPVDDEDLHSASLSAIFIQDFANSPWFGIAWTRAELATDFQAIGEEDVTFDVALGAGYKFSDTFSLGAGFVVTNLNGNVEFFPGINFFWTPSDDFSVALYGPNLTAKYNINENWYVSADVENGGGVWNFNDEQGNSRSIELDSYWVSISTNHRITGDLWLSAGIGYSFGNEIEVRGNRDNGPSTSRDLDGAPLAQIGLNLRSW